MCCFHPDSSTSSVDSFFSFTLCWTFGCPLSLSVSHGLDAGGTGFSTRPSLTAPSPHLIYVSQLCADFAPQLCGNLYAGRRT